MPKKIVVITLPNDFCDETVICNLLFDNGLRQLHLRKPNYTAYNYTDFIERIEPKYRGRIVIHDCFELVEKYGLRGIHLNSTLYKSFNEFDRYGFISVSCHSIQEVKQLHPRVSECFLSPIFDSISKEGYTKAFDEKYLREKLSELHKPILALGGVCEDNLYRAFDLGFSGVALLGGLWGKSDVPQYADVIRNWRNINTPRILSIAGFDPSSGAGVSADVRTANDIGVYALGVNTANTVQNQYEFYNVQWIDIDLIKRQIDAIASQNDVYFIKIGIVESFEVLYEICCYINQKIPYAKICWDTILSSSSGFVFHDNTKRALLEAILNKVYLITPNYDEAISLFNKDISKEHLSYLSKKYEVNILLKGGHCSEYDTVSTDILFSGNDIESFTVLRSDEKKHGTGCMLSTAIVSYMAKGLSISEAIRFGQIYVARKINENKGLLFFNSEYHTNIPMITKDIKLMFLTHYSDSISIAQQVELACKADIKLVQLRMKDTDDKEFFRQARIALQICRRYNTLLIINDNVDICMQVGADGVHLGKEDTTIERAREILGENKIIGATCNTFDDVAEAYRNGADYVGVGPFRHTTTKKKLSPILGIDGLANVVKQMKIKNIDLPSYAIGGIEVNHVSQIIACGIHGVAMSGAIINSSDINHYIQTIYKNIEQCKN